MERKEYLGDSVYADHDGYMVTLTTENGCGPSNTLHLEPGVLCALAKYLARQLPSVARALTHALPSDE